MIFQEYDIIVIGAGPSGVAASLTSALNGAKVLIVDSSFDTGGQVYKPPPDTFQEIKKNYSTEIKIQKYHKKLLEEHGVHIALEHTVWQVSKGFQIYAFNNRNKKISWKCKTLIVATGTYERIIPFPGWTSPGVIGLAASTTLLKSHRVLPGYNTIVAGCGPLLAVVASGIIRAGGHVKAVIDLNGPFSWFSSISSMLTNPSSLIQGIGWLKDIIFSRTPIYFNSTVKEVINHKNELEINITKINSKGLINTENIIKINADSLCIGHGLIPSLDILTILGVKKFFDFQSASWLAKTDKYFQTSVNNLYIVGDGAGISGAVPAYEKGLLAGHSASLNLNFISHKYFQRITKKIFVKLKKFEKFGKSMAKLMTPPSSLIQNITDDTIICRCEDIKRGEIEKAIKSGAIEINQLKAWTRCGMGPCQGRTCEDTIARIMADHVGDRQTVGMFARKIPIKPIPMDCAVGDFKYEDIKKVEEAPL